MNLLSWLGQNHAFPIKDAQIICIFRDWSVMEARRDPSYPQKQVKVIPVTLWPYEKAEAFCRERVRVHAQAQSGELPECTPEERWERAPVWAVMKKGRKRAVKLYDNEKDAQKHATSEKQCSVEYRKGQSIRCQSYCSAAPYCDQWKRMGGMPDMAAQMEDSGEGIEEGMGMGAAPVPAPVAAPAPAPAPVAPAPKPAAPVQNQGAPVQNQPRRDEFPVEPDVASPGSPPPPKRTPAPARAAKPESPAFTGPNFVPPPPPAALVSRDEPIPVVDSPPPPMPEVTEVPQ